MLHATIDLNTFLGEGYLEVIPNWKSPQEFRDEEKKRKLEEEQRQKEADAAKEVAEKEAKSKENASA